MKKILLAVLILGLISISFFMPRLFSKEQKNIFSIGKMSDFPEGSIKFISSARVLVIAGKEGIYAISAICTYRGCLIKEGLDFSKIIPTGTKLKRILPK